MSHDVIECDRSIWPGAIRVDRAAPASLVSQIVESVERSIDAGILRPGEKIPSVRCLARRLQVSTFTVLEANERLVASGLLYARRGAGYFVSRLHKTGASHGSAAGLEHGCLLRAYSPGRVAPQAGIPVSGSHLPSDWYGDGWIQDAARRALRVHPDRLLSAGNPLGLHELRRLMAQRLGASLVAVDEHQVMVTAGATHAWDLLLRTLCRPGDRVGMEDPGSPTLRALILRHGCIPVPVHRGAEGLDIDALCADCLRATPRLLFIQTVYQNPLGTTLSPLQLHRLLALAERFDLLVVESDMYRAMGEPGQPCLAAMDGLKRVVRVDSTTTTLSPLLRVGFIFASPTLISKLVDSKVATGFAGTRLEERIVCQILGSSEYRRMVARLQARIGTCLTSGTERLHRLGMRPLAQPTGGIFISAVLPSPDGVGAADEARISEAASASGLAVKAGSAFSCRSGDRAWIRLNIAYLDHPALSRFVERLRGAADGRNRHNFATSNLAKDTTDEHLES